MEVWFDEYFQKNLVGRDLLSQMIYKGKMMYFLDKMLPELSMGDKFRFNREQMVWVEENEASVWEYFIEEDLLFSKKESESLIKNVVAETDITCFKKIGKNFYITSIKQGIKITVNSTTFRIITVDKMIT
jgi:hypothetical protein